MSCHVRALHLREEKRRPAVRSQAPGEEMKAGKVKEKRNVHGPVVKNASILPMHPIPLPWDVTEPAAQINAQLCHAMPPDASNAKMAPVK